MSKPTQCCGQNYADMVSNFKSVTNTTVFSKNTQHPHSNTKMSTSTSTMPALTTQKTMFNLTNFTASGFLKYNNPKN